MQCFTIIFLISSIVITTSAIRPAELMKLQKTLHQCNTKHTVDQSVISQALNGELVKNREFDCLIACILKGINVTNTDGSLNITSALRKLPDDTKNRNAIVQHIKTCGVQKSNDECETAHLLYECMAELNIPSVFLG